MDFRSLASVGLALTATACARPAMQPATAPARPDPARQAVPQPTEAAATPRTGAPATAATDVPVGDRKAADPPAAEVATAASDEPEAAPTEGVASAGDEPRDDPFLELDKDPPCPDEMALVNERVCVDRWEAALVEVMASGEERDWSPYKSASKTGITVRAVSRPMVVPQGYISGLEADAACQASGKRLCTVNEWESACRGPKNTTYPYGHKRRKYVCSDDSRKVHPVAEVTQRFGLPKERMWYEGMEHPMINQLDKTLRKTGERDKCTNALGIFDMVGNLHEWIADPKGTFRGGFYLDTKINGEGCNYATTAHSKGYSDYSTGFRCCMDAKLDDE
jgi:hypothetical protein